MSEIKKNHGGARKGSGRKKTLNNPKKFLGYKVEDYEYEKMRKNLENYVEKNKLKNTTEAIKKIFLELIKWKIYFE